MYVSVISLLLVLYKVKISQHLHELSSIISSPGYIGDLTRETFNRPHSLKTGDMQYPCIPPPPQLGYYGKKTHPLPSPKDGILEILAEGS